MKKRGFTLAEVLIALTLVGVIAAMTMPSVVTNSKAKTNVAKLASTVSALENAFATMMISEAVQDITETKFGESQNLDFKELEKYLKTTKIETNEITMKNGAIIDKFNVKKVLEDNDKGLPGALMSIDIDINGKGKPDMPGVDQFRFAVGNNGTLYPAGGEIYEDMYDDTDCSCTATIVEKGYTIK